MSKKSRAPKQQPTAAPVVAKPQPVAAADPAAKRDTRSFTPAQHYNAVALIAVDAHESITVTDEQMAAFEADVAAYASKLAAKTFSIATEQTVKASTRWTAVHLDTAESKRTPKTRTASTGKRLDAMFEAAIDVNAIMADAKARVAAGADKRTAILAAAKAHNATEAQLYAIFGIKPEAPVAK